MRLEPQQVRIGLGRPARTGESMGARLWCEPAQSDGTGARFVLALPAAIAV